LGPKSAKINSALMIGPILIATILIYLGQRALFVVPYSIGFWFFFKAKRSVLTKDRIISFGPSGMTKKMKIYYFLGYAIMISSAAFALLYLEKR